MRKTTVIVMVGGLVALAVTLGVLTGEPDTVPYHLARLSRSMRPTTKMPPADLKGYFRLETLSWYLKGRQSGQAQREKAVQALIRLGYFERREFPLQYRLLDLQFIDELHSTCSSNLCLRTNKYWAMDYNRTTSVVRVTIRKEAMPICESIIATLDRKADQ